VLNSGVMNKNAPAASGASNGKLVVAVLFGGRSPEHDVSVVSALQAMNALDTHLYEVLPVYITTRGEWLTGEALRRRDSYIPKADAPGLISVRLDLVPQRRPRFIAGKPGLFRKENVIEFDVALPIFHGLVGEDGGIQGLLETANVPYTGMRLMASALLMDKVATKRMLSSVGVPVLPFREVRRPASGTYVPSEILNSILDGLAPPYCVKPSHLGSSIGVGKAENVEDVAALLPGIFLYDDTAIIEPFVPHMVEYNVAVRSAGATGEIVTSAIERPKRTEELLDFKEKYLSGGGKKAGVKTPGQSSEGMLSLTRDINPALPPQMESNIRSWAQATFSCVYGSGAPRIDFISNEKTGEVWLNEVNPCPGSLGFFLWEASRDNPALFTVLLDHLIAEARALHRNHQLPADPVPEAARLLKR
jgi:D-alanine-D-alanine ligase